MSQKRYLTIALTKGRLAHDTLELFERIGVNTAGAMDKKTRKLIFTNEELGLRFFLAKGPDVPTYVYYGAADIGIVGRDTIIEENKKLYEVLDLGYGKCRMCVDYFYRRKNQTVEIIKLNGSIELAPIVGLAEVIVDIVETGSTLRENGLEVLEEVLDLSARMVVNQVSMKMQNDRITELITRLRNELSKNI